MLNKQEVLDLGFQEATSEDGHFPEIGNWVYKKSFKEGYLTVGLHLWEDTTSINYIKGEDETLFLLRKLFLGQVSDIEDLKQLLEEYGNKC